jgi:hypothetical protein
VDLGSTSSWATVLGNPKRERVPSIYLGCSQRGRGFQKLPGQGSFLLWLRNIRSPRGNPKPWRLRNLVDETATRWLGIVPILVLLLSTVSSGVEGQEGAYAFQIRGGVTQPLGDFLDESMGWEGRAGAGSSMAMGFTFPLYRFIGGLVGFSQHRFACDENVCPEGKAWISTGFDVAIRIAGKRGPVRPWIQGGFHNHRIQVKILEDGLPRKVNSDGGGGLEAGLGLLVQIGERTSLSPGVRYGLGNVPFSDHPTLDLSFLVFDVGLVIGF